MNKIDIFKKLMQKAQSNGYLGPDYKYEIGKILHETNAYSIFFREDFSKAIWGDSSIFYESGKGLQATKDVVPRWQAGLSKLAIAEDKWKFLENNVVLD
jgi:hypothetical protein